MNTLILLFKILFWTYLIPMFSSWILLKFYPTDKTLICNEQDRIDTFKITFIPLLNIILIIIFVDNIRKLIWERKIKVIGNKFLDKLYNLIIK